MMLHGFEGISMCKSSKRMGKVADAGSRADDAARWGVCVRVRAARRLEVSK
jgi:hypothetical protein